MRMVWQIVRRMTHKILGVKGLKLHSRYKMENLERTWHNGSHGIFYLLMQCKIHLVHMLLQLYPWHVGYKYQQCQGSANVIYLVYEMSIKFSKNLTQNS